MHVKFFSPAPRYVEAQNADAAGAVAIIVVNNVVETNAASRASNFIAMDAEQSSGVSLPMLAIPKKAGTHERRPRTPFRL